LRAIQVTRRKSWSKSFPLCRICLI